MSISSEEEKKLVEEARHDPQAFEEIFEKYYDPILHYILKRVGEIQTAEDITSQTFFTLYKKLWQFRWRNIPFSAWLYRIAGNEVNQHFRRKKHGNLSLELLMRDKKWEPADQQNIQEELREAEKTIENHHDFLKIQTTLVRLPTKYQEVITLKYFEGKKFTEISNILGKKENTVKSLAKRGVERLQKELKKTSTHQHRNFF